MYKANTVSIVIVNWNAGTQLVACIASVAQYQHDLVATVIVVDNGSTDNSIKQVEALQNLPFELQIVRNSANRGFGAACNQGAALALSEFLLFLNPDTRLFENSLTAPYAFMNASKNQKVGVVGIQLIDDHNQVSRSCARFPTLGIFVAQVFGINYLPGLQYLNTHMMDWAHETTATVDHVIGAFYLMRLSLFESLSGFDERFFVYLEDLDLSLRVHQAGYLSVFLADAQAFHLGGGTSRQVKAHRLFYSLRSRLFYGFKYFPKHKAWILLFITTAIEPWSRLLFALSKGSWRDALYTLQAYVLLIKSLPEFFLRYDSFEHDAKTQG